jgi:hypothetical protein
MWSRKQIRRYPRCPRCGYDLTGQVASWRERCPMRDVCSECGGEFFSPEVMRRMEFGPMSLFEHAPRLRGWAGVQAFTDTSGLVFLPRTLWRVIGRGGQWPVRRGRLAAYVLIWAVLMHLALLAMSQVLMIWHPFDSPGVLDFLPVPYGEVMVPSNASALTLAGPGAWVPMTGRALLAVTIWPVLLMGVLAWRRAAKCGPGAGPLVWRGLAYTLPVGLLWFPVLFFALMLVAIAGEIAPPWAHPLIAASAVLLALWPTVFLGHWWRMYMREHMGVPAGIGTTVVIILLGLGTGVPAMVALVLRGWM